MCVIHKNKGDGKMKYIEQNLWNEILNLRKLSEKSHFKQWVSDMDVDRYMLFRTNPTWKRGLLVMSDGKITDVIFDHGEIIEQTAFGDE